MELMSYEFSYRNFFFFQFFFRFCASFSERTKKFSKDFLFSVGEECFPSLMRIPGGIFGFKSSLKILSFAYLRKSSGAPTMAGPGLFSLSKVDSNISYR